MNRIKKTLDGLYYGVLRQLYDMIGEDNAKSSFSIRLLKLVYLNGNNAAEGKNNNKYANSYPMN